MLLVKRLVPLFSLLALWSCADSGNETGYAAPDDPLFSTLASATTGVDFINTVADGENFNVLSYRNFYNGAGVAIGDLNGDGLPDLYFAANQGPNRLYLNEGGLRFREVENSVAAGTAESWSTGVTIVDVNQDGKNDLYVCNSGDVEGGSRANQLFLQTEPNAAGDPQFVEAAADYGLADAGYSTQAAWFDYDRDGDLDVYLLNNSYLSAANIVPGADNRKERDAAGGDKLLRNDGPRTASGGGFTDVSEEANVFGSRIGFGLGSGLGDFNGDGWTDLYVSNDFWERDYLYINQQNGTFAEQLIDRMDHVSISSMGSDVGDLDNDGDVDLFSTDMLPASNTRLKSAVLFDNYNTEAIKHAKDYHYQMLQNCLQVNDGSGRFVEVAHYAGVGATDWSWGALIFDLDNDGNKDIFVANGIYRDVMNLDFSDFLADKSKVQEMVEKTGRYDWRDFVELLPNNAQANYAFLNQGELRFDNQAAALGLGKPTTSNGAAYGDLDGDGDLDLVLNNVNQEAIIYQNQSSERGAHSLTVSLKGPTGNPDGVGARVTLATADGGRQILEQYPSRGFLSNVGTQLIFGLGTTTEVASVTVDWPDGTTSVVDNPPVDETLEIAVSSAQRPAVADAGTPAPAAYFTASPGLLSEPAVHEEPFFNDFDHEALLLRKFSDPGPKVVKGDPNGDGLEDFLLLGSYDDPDKLFLQQADGTFRREANSFLDGTAYYESSCGAFFDADGDGDEDLMIGNGGNEFARGFSAYAIRYYENVKGKLVYNQVKAPQGGGEVSCIVPGDADLDGDLDVFIGGRIVPGNYGLVPQSFLFINEGGSWVNQTPKDIGTAGMIMDAAWADLNGDTRPDLVMVGEWLPISVAFTLNDAAISEVFQIPNSSGWWQSIEVADLDDDGKEDLVLGNWGLNSKFRASVERPLEMHLKDYDDNQKSEFIIEWYPTAAEDKTFFASKRELHGQLPHLRKKTLSYENFARATYETLFTEEERQGASHWEAVELRSSVIWNKGEGQVRIEPLPWQAQLTPQTAVALEDVNGDGKKDIWLGGNIHGLTPQVGRADAGRGTLLLNEGNRNFSFVDNTTAGINIRGQVRDAQYVELAGGNKALLVGCNNEALKVYTLNEQPTKK